MNINKVIYKSEQFVSLYREQKRDKLLDGVKKLNYPISSKGYTLLIKYLYLYQYCKINQPFPQWYAVLMQNRLQELHDYFEITFSDIVTYRHEVDQELEEFLTKRIAWLYKGKFRVYPTTPIDYLPLKLRLKVYLYLYHAEDDPKACCHLRNRIAVTLAKLGHLEVANLFSIYNWLMAQGINTHFSKSTNLKTTLMQHKRADEYNKKLNQENQEFPLLTELCFYYTKLLNRKFIKYDRANIATIDLVTLYYKQYPQLENLSLPLKTYLRTKDMNALYNKISMFRMQFIRECANLSNEDIADINLINDDQLILYNYLLRICN